MNKWLFIMCLFITPGLIHASPELKAEAYEWKSVKIGGGGFVSGLQFHPKERGLAYARTDVGGAYRWDEAERRWVALTDFLGMEDVNLTGIESLALDPEDPKKVYLAAGTYTAEHVGVGAIFRSSDRGAHFERTDMPFKMGANEAGRGNGERLVVDPNDGTILFFGSRLNGLWRSADGGVTWAEVVGFPAAAKTEATASAGGGRFVQHIGIPFVFFDPRSGKPGAGSQTLYAGISLPHGETLWRSEDAGRTWKAVPGQATGLRPTRAVFCEDGILYLTYGDEPGPNTMRRGAVWRLDTGSGEWREITPLDPAKSASGGFGYGAVTAAAGDSSKLLVTTFCRYTPEHDEIFRSLDAGRSWTPVFARSDFDHSSSPWASTHSPHWMADIKLDPFDSGHALFVTGYGVYRTHELGQLEKGGRVRWDFDDEGIEETVPLDLISPPEGAPLLSALGDIDGFRHEKLDTIGEEYPPTPRFANSESLAYAQLRPAVVVRCGTVRGRTNEVRIAWSEDGGSSWRVMSTEPEGSNGAGVVDISADAAVITWTPRGQPPAGVSGAAAWKAWPGTPALTRDHGATWETPSGLPKGVVMVADKVEPGRFYALDASSGILYSSTDSGRSFQARCTTLPAASATSGGFGGGGAAGGQLHSVPGRAGELWLETRAQGLQVSRDGGLHFERIAQVQEAYSLGFGKAPAGRTHPTLFLAGRVAGKQGLFRSDDEGAHWLSIDDAQHRFGWINHVTGDPRVFGRVYFGTAGRGIIYGQPR